MRVKCLSQEHNTMSLARARTPESSAVTMGPPCLPLGGITKLFQVFPAGNSEICFPSTSVGIRETKLTISLGASHQVLILNCNLTVFNYCYQKRFKTKTHFSTMVFFSLQICLQVILQASIEFHLQ